MSDEPAHAPQSENGQHHSSVEPENRDKHTLEQIGEGQRQVIGSTSEKPENQDDQEKHHNGVNGHQPTLLDGSERPSSEAEKNMVNGIKNTIIKQESVEDDEGSEQGSGQEKGFRLAAGMVVEKKAKEPSLRRIEMNLSSHEEEIGLSKKRTHEQITSSRIPSHIQNPFRSKRKVRPQVNCPHLEYHNPEERLALIEHLFRECQSSSRKLTRKNPNNLSHISAWVHNEFFYSNYERPYFDENDFKELLDCVDMPNSELTHGDFRLIQKCMGKPRLFTQAYITEERLSLEDTRDIARSYSGTLNVSILNERLLNSNSNKYYERVEHLQQKANVLALANCGHFHLGTVMGEHKEGISIVKFGTVELGVQKIPDALISSQYTICNRSDFKNIQDILNPPKPNQLIQHMDYFATSLFFKILLIKARLLDCLKEFNQQAAKIRQSDGEITDDLKNGTAVLLTYLQRLEVISRSALVAFRLRGSPSYSRQQIAKSMGKLLINPLNFMEKELEANQEPGDSFAIQQISQILQTQQENKVEEMTKVLCENGKRSNDIFESEEGKLARNCLAILIGMKMENRPSSELVENKYMKNISQLIYNNFGEELNEINRCIATICNK